MLDLLEAAYRVGGTDEDWLRTLAEGSRPMLDDGLGTAAYVYDARDPNAASILSLSHSADFKIEWLQTFMVEAAKTRIVAQERHEPCGLDKWMTLPAGTVSGIEGMSDVERLLPAFGGARDVLALNGLDPSGYGIWLGAPLRKKKKIDEAEVNVLARVASHLAAASRLRRVVKPGVALADQAEAVLDPGGAVVHAEAPAKGKAEREALRSAVVAMERARSSTGRTDAESATRKWSPLVDGRWSLLDDFQHHQNRYVVAVKNDVDVGRFGRALSDRERQVLARAAMGRSNKIIAYELGVTVATVRVLMHRAAEKLGARGRAQLVARYAELVARLNS